MNELAKISISAQAMRLTEPFTMVDLAQIDDLALSVFLCQGTLPHHRHLDQDELFLVHHGTITLESDWGNVVLRPGELAVAPKGLGHRSSSLLRSLVLLLQPRLMVNRRNGDRRLFTLVGEKRLEKVSVPALGRQLAVPHRPVLLAHLDTYAVYVMICEGTGPWWQVEDQDSLVLVHDGRLTLQTAETHLPLDGGELAIVPKGVAYRLDSLEKTIVLGVRRHKQAASPLLE